MLPQAKISHVTPGRVRFQLMEKEHDSRGMEAIGQSLKECPEVKKFSGNPLTGSIVVYHDGDVEGVLDFARRRGLFQCDRPPSNMQKQATHLADTISDKVKQLDGSLYRASGGELGLPTLGFITLAGLALYQLKKGHYLPAGHALASQAFNLLLAGRMES